MSGALPELHLSALVDLRISQQARSQVPAQLEFSTTRVSSAVFVRGRGLIGSSTARGSPGRVFFLVGRGSLFPRFSSLGYARPRCVPPFRQTCHNCGICTSSPSTISCECFPVGGFSAQFERFILRDSSSCIYDSSGSRCSCFWCFSCTGFLPCLLAWL